MGLFDFFRSREKKLSRPMNSQGVFDGLDENQKYAIATMLASLAYAPTSEQQQQVVYKMFIFSVNTIGLSENQLVRYMQSGQKMTPNKMLVTIGTIHDESVIQWLIYTANGIASMTGNSQAMSYLHSWFNQLGYSDTYIQESISKVELLGKMMRGL